VFGKNTKQLAYKGFITELSFKYICYQIRSAYPDGDCELRRCKVFASFGSYILAHGLVKNALKLYKQSFQTRAASPNS